MGVYYTKTCIMALYSCNKLRFDCPIISYGFLIYYICVQCTLILYVIKTYYCSCKYNEIGKYHVQTFNVTKYEYHEKKKTNKYIIIIWRTLICTYTIWTRLLFNDIGKLNKPRFIRIETYGKFNQLFYYNIMGKHKKYKIKKFLFC